MEEEKPQTEREPKADKLWEPRVPRQKNKNKSCAGVHRLPQGTCPYQGWLLYNSADPVPTPASLTDPREGQKAAGEGLSLSSSDGSLLGPRKPTVGNTHP